jgi:hypothetical protein
MDLMLDEIGLSEVVFVPAEYIGKFIENFQIPVHFFRCAEDVGLIFDEPLVLLSDHLFLDHIDVGRMGRCIRQRKELDWIYRLINA